MAFRRALILGNPDGRYVRELVASAPTDLPVVSADFASLHSRLGGTPPGWAGQVAKTGGETFWLDSHCITPQDLVVVRSMALGSLETIVFRMDLLAGLERQGTLVLNPAKGLELAIDKYLSLSLLAELGFPVPATRTSQTAAHAMDAFESLGCDVVVKPIFGSEGRGLIRVCDRDHAARVFRSLEVLGHVIYQQAFIHHGGRDYRILILGRQAWSIERRHPSDWRTNRSRGATCHPVDLPQALVEMAVTICRQLRLPVAGLDFVHDPATNQYLVLEVNAVPGWQGINEAYQIDIATQFWRFATGCLADPQLAK